MCRTYLKAMHLQNQSKSPRQTGSCLAPDAGHEKVILGDPMAYLAPPSLAKSQILHVSPPLPLLSMRLIYNMPEYQDCVNRDRESWDMVSLLLVKSSSSFGKGTKGT